MAIKMSQEFETAIVAYYQIKRDIQIFKLLYACKLRNERAYLTHWELSASCDTSLHSTVADREH